jgi:hypothetical protein
MQKKFNTLLEAYSFIRESGIPEDEYQPQDIEIEPSGPLDVEKEVTVPANFLIELLNFIDDQIQLAGDEEKSFLLQKRDELQNFIVGE